MNIHVTGGAGFIGSHICVELAKAGHRPVVLDNLCNSKPSVMERVGRIIGKRGRMASAIRTVTRAAAARDGVEIDVEFVD